MQVRWARTFCKFRMVDRKLWGPAQKRIHQNKLETTERMKGHIWGGAHQGQNYLWVLNSSRILSPNIAPENYPEYYLWILSLDIKFLWNILLRMRFDKVGLIKAVGWPVGPSRTTSTVYEKYIIRIWNICVNNKSKLLLCNIASTI